MGFKLNPAQEAAVKARAAAKKKVGDLSFKPSDAQRRAILRMETNKTMAELEKSLRDEEPAPAPKTKAPGEKFYIDDEGKDSVRAYTLNDKGRLVTYAFKLKRDVLNVDGNIEHEAGVWHTMNSAGTKEALVEGDSVYKVIHKKKGGGKDKKLLKTVYELK
jgi:hypothetical protein